MQLKVDDATFLENLCCLSLAQSLGVYFLILVLSLMYKIETSVIYFLNLVMKRTIV